MMRRENLSPTGYLGHHRSLNSFINNHTETSSSFAYGQGSDFESGILRRTHSHNENLNGDEGKKYKLRLKFDGSCALEVVRLNGGHFQNLTHLDISGNLAEKLDLRSLSRLEWLCCSNNQLEVLSLSGNSLTYLDCSNNNLQSISIEPVPNNLSTLQISFNNLEELPLWTWMVPELFIIYASHNRLRQLDCKFQNCLAHLPIRELHLHCNKIEFVSKDFVQRSTRLKILNLSQNLIEYMPNFGKRSPIQELYMSRNKLQDTDEKEALDFLLECSHLKRLYLAFNKIEHINERCLNSWKHLEELILCGNRIRILPSKISNLLHLRVLRVHANRLENAPNLTKMPVLKVVDLSHNNLRKINLDHLISGGNLTYLDISCNERLSLDPEKLNNPKRPMNLVEVSNPRKAFFPSRRNNEFHREFPPNPPWEIGFSELPDRNQTLSVTQYRDGNLSGGKEALFGIFDGGDGNAAPKSISKSIAKIFTEERNIEETNKYSLKYTLLNAMKRIRQTGNVRPLQGVLCLLSMEEDLLVPGKPSFTLNVSMIGGIRCLLVESGKKITRLTDMAEGTSIKRAGSEGDELPSPPDLPESEYNSKTIRDGFVAQQPNNLSTTSIPDPKVLSVELSPTSEYLIVGNAALWNYVSESELIDELEVHRHKKTVLVAKRITDMAQSHSCKQSLSLIVVRFKWSQGNFPVLGSFEKTKLALLGDLGPLSYNSASSDYSDDVCSTPVVSVGTTPDSAIETDRSSGPGSLNSGRGSMTNNLKHTQEEKKNLHNNRRHHNNGTKGSDEDLESLANTTISQMSVEQFRCWEYMLEQNTKLLFKKELDSMSKGVFSRNQKLRKSVHFPYQNEGGPLLFPNNSNGGNPTGVSKNFNSPPASLFTGTGHNNNNATVGKTSNPGFYTLSKAKSLSQLFAAEPLGVPEKTRAAPNKPPTKGGFLGIGPMRPSPTFGTIRGGPNAAYFGSAQRIPPSSLYESAEIREVKNYDSIEHESRLKKYWDNKVTEL